MSSEPADVGRGESALCVGGGDGSCGGGFGLPGLGETAGLVGGEVGVV